MSVWKCFVAATAEELCSVVILYTKFFSFCSIYWRFGFWSSALFAAGWIVLSSVFPQPWYRGPTKIFELNEAAFRDKVQLKKSTTVPVEDVKGPRITEVEDENEKDTKKPEIDSKYWIVMLYANWSVTCLNFEPVLAKLSIEYDLPQLKFGQIDIDVYPNLAEEFGVSKDPASFDLPTLILFQQGKEIRRLPELTMPKEGTKLTKASAAKDTITRLGWNKKSSTVVTAFQLEKIASEKAN
ncbi:thioredoxin-like protein [Pilaira anomala]|nr:thioredoxin-like protein [Pilaira anomala]